jgi:hypothetical protein
MGSGVLGLGLDSISTYGSVWGLGDGFCTNMSPNFGIVQLNFYALAPWWWAGLSPIQQNNITLCAPPNNVTPLTTFNSTSFGPQSTYFAFGQINSTEDIFMQNLLDENASASVTIST